MPGDCRRSVRPGLAAALATAALAGCGGGGDDGGPARAVAAAPEASSATGRSTGPGLAVGITEPNPNLVSAGSVAPEFSPWRDALGRMRPAYYRLLLDWASLQPDPARPLELENPDAGCLRAAPCAGWNGLREQLRALASRQRAGGWQGVAVVSGTPDWAARPPGGCERAGTEPRSRPPTAAGVAGYRRMVDAVLAAAQREGASLRYWSAWNEPNHPYGLSPQRDACTPRAPSAAAGTYTALTRALQATLDAAPGEQEQVLGELAALDERKPQTPRSGSSSRACPAPPCAGRASSPSTDTSTASIPRRRSRGPCAASAAGAPSRSG